MRILSLIVSISVAVGLVSATRTTTTAAAAANLDAGIKKRSTLIKRDYATTLQYLRTAMESYLNNAATLPSAASPQPIQAAAQAQPGEAVPVTVDPVWAIETEPLLLPAPQAIIPPAQQPQPIMPDWGNVPPSLLPMNNDPVTPEQQPANEVAVSQELGNEEAEKMTLDDADFEEDDAFDPEEDPDDVDDPPVVDGIAVDREE